MLKCLLLFIVLAVSLLSFDLLTATDINAIFLQYGSVTLVFSLIKPTQCKQGARSRGCASFTETWDLRTLHMRLQRERGACRDHSSTAVKVKTLCCCCRRCLFCPDVEPTAQNLAYILWPWSTWEVFPNEPSGGQKLHNRDVTRLEQCKHTTAHAHLGDQKGRKRRYELTVFESNSWCCWAKTLSTLAASVNVTNPNPLQGRRDNKHNV